MRKRNVQVGVLVVLLAALALIIFYRQALRDWWRLRDYQAPAAVSRLAVDDTMTGEAKHLFYVNHPDITSGSAFTSHCPNGSEKTVVLGCYVGDDAGIYIYDVSDPRLSGVEQVTAAHEMLHAAYNRLDSATRQRVDTMLLDYYHHDLTDQRIKGTLDSYKQSEPDAIVDEMHSIFGTEIANLPAPLEQYYRQYFTDRAKVAGYAAQYQAEFTNRQQQVKADDARLSDLKAQIATDEQQLQQQSALLDSERTQLQAERNGGNAAQYNDQVRNYNAAVNSYNSLLDATKNLINQYNSIVDERNAVALEEQQLVQALSPSSLPASQ